METRSRTRLLRRAGLAVVALGALVVPATADAATKTPVITKVTPKNVSVGETLIVNGKNFRTGKGKNTVLFRPDKGKALFVKAGLSTKKQIAVVIPKTLEKFMANSGGNPVATRFRLRVLTTKLSKTFTAVKSSPVVGPEKPKTATGPGAGTAVVAPPDGDCDGDGVLNSADTDDDNDLLPDTQEIALKLDPCNGDTDGDGAEDGFEYQSALDLNNDDYQHLNFITPYPYKTPYPNPLFADADVDYDGDGLTLSEEYHLWQYTYTINHTATRTLSPLSYSDGTQYSYSQLVGGNGMRQRTMLVSAYQPPKNFRQWADANGYGTVMLHALGGGQVYQPFDIYDMDRDGVVTTTRTGGQESAEATYWDLDDDGYVSDDERDEDSDGLNNYYELHGPASASWWKACYGTEGEYPVKFADISAWDADTDGDGILDGADDQDFDGVPNIMELSRSMSGDRLPGMCGTQGTYDPTAPDLAYVNPFNPCLPDVYSRTCQRHPQIGKPYAPFIDNFQPVILH